MYEAVKAGFWAVGITETFGAGQNKVVCRVVRLGSVCFKVGMKARQSDEA